MQAGLKALDRALSVVEGTGEGYYEAELHRLKGELTLRHQGGQSKESPGLQEAEACFHQAIAVARHRGAKSPELRAILSLARLWQQQGQREPALHILTEIHGFFTEGFETADLSQAKALLDELAQIDGP
ncbi:hypothetical protein D3C72_1734780 [compost metagenome]